MSEPVQRPRGAYAAAAAAVFAVIGVLAVVNSLDDGSGPPQPGRAQAGTVEVATTPVPRPEAPDNMSRPTPSAPASPSPRPVHLDISAIGVHTSLLELGLNSDGSLQVPWKPLLAGWFTQSPSPGTVGPSVIAGHVDSYATGPAVFYRLGAVVPGDTVAVSRADGTRVTFVVDAVREYPKAHFPTGPVYGNTDRAELRLITCGDWDASNSEYDGNIVVFAHLRG